MPSISHKSQGRHTETPARTEDSEGVPNLSHALTVRGAQAGPLLQGILKDSDHGTDHGKGSDSGKDNGSGNGNGSGNDDNYIVIYG